MCFKEQDYKKHRGLHWVNLTYKKLGLRSIRSKRFLFFSRIVQNTPVSLTHANPPHTIPTGKTLRRDCVGSSPLDKTLCGKPHVSPTQSVYHYFVPTQSPLTLMYIPTQSPRDPHANVAFQLAPRKMVLGRPFPT